MITIDIVKAKDIAHGKRREARAAEFAPLDQQIALQLPGIDPASIEAQRQAIRDKFATIQTRIDEATDVEALANILARLGDNGIEK